MSMLFSRRRIGCLVAFVMFGLSQQVHAQTENWIPAWAKSAFRSTKEPAAPSTPGESAAVNEETPGEGSTVSPNSEGEGMFGKLPAWATRMKTLGGRQFWGDMFYCSGWRIQRNVLTGHYRLLDPHDCRCVSGTEESCQQEFERRRIAEDVPAMKGRAVVFVHGIIRSSKSFEPMQRALASAGWNVVGFDYPSTRVPIAESARYFEQVIRSLEGVDEVDLVVHSMGGLVVRSYIEQCGEAGPDPRIKRMVMLGVPNQGASLANTFQGNTLYKAIYGPAGQELVEGEDAAVTKLPTPPFEFAIIAGGRAAERGYNPLLHGDNDGTVTVESARLPGAADSIVVPSTHSFLMSNEHVIDHTRRFLETGALRASKEKQPIPKGSAE